MFSRLALPLVLTILWLWPASLHAQSEALTEAFQQGLSLYKAGQYEQAVPLWRKALELGEQEYGPVHPTTAGLINDLAQLYRLLGRYAEAEPLYKRALAIREMALGPDHPDVGESLNNLALLYKTQGRYSQAEPLYRRDLAILEKALGKAHPYVATNLNNLALVLSRFTSACHPAADILSATADFCS